MVKQLRPGLVLVFACAGWLAACSSSNGNDSGTGSDIGPECGTGQSACSNACVDTQTDPRHCGACGMACPGGQVCTAGACAVSCPMGQTVCGGLCASVQTDRQNCGACGHACPAGQVCSMGACTLQCASSLMACGADDAGTGRYCADPQTDRLNCGTCGNACPAGSQCLAGSCALGCPTGQMACGGQCVSTITDRAHCGACGNACAAGQVCAMGTCTVDCGTVLTTCPGGTTDAGTDAGAERYCALTSLDPRNCGTCGTVCTAAAHAVAFCVAGACQSACAAGWADCNGNASDGCEADLTQPANCGRCGNECPVGDHATATCTAVAGGRTCGVTCNTGYGDCNLDAEDGCEVALDTSTSNCGACGRTCHVTSGTCAAGVCSTGTCATGWGNCNSMTADGCETNLTTLTNCGSCGNACPAAPAHAVASCSGSMCTTPVCLGGWGDCNSTMTDGCEADLLTPAHCGGCSTACPSGQICAGNACAATGYSVTRGTATFIDCTTLPGATRGILATRDDAVADAITLPFSFRFWGTATTTVRPSTNGYVMFGSTTSNDSNYSPNDLLPDTDRPRPAAFVLNGDLYTRTGICAGVTGTAPNRRFVVEWVDNSTCCSTDVTAPHLTFEMVLNEADHSLDYVYQPLDVATDSRSINIGLQNAAGTAAANLQYDSLPDLMVRPGGSYHFAPTGL